MLKIQLPFEGFHDGSPADSEETHEYQHLCDHLAQQEQDHDPDLRLTEEEIENIAWRNTDFGKAEARQRVRKDYVAAFCEMIDDTLDMETGLVPDPDSDHGLCDALVPEETVQAWFAMSAIVKHKHLIGEMDDFDPADSKPVTEWGPVALHYLLQATLRQRGVEDFSRDVLIELCQGETFSQAFDLCVDYPELYAEIEQARAQLAAELPEHHPARQDPPPVRCPDTLELPL